MDARRAAAEFEAMYRAVYLRLHARRTKRTDRPTAQTVAVLQHLARTGPLTVGEAARHLGRAQSVVSEIFERMERRGLLSRIRDERDWRRALVWLTDEGRRTLERLDEVLDPGRVERALARLPAAARRTLVETLRALVRAADDDTPPEKERRSE